MKSPILRSLFTAAAIATAGLSFHPALAQGEGGGGVRGGEVVDVNGTPELRDLIERAKCDYKTGEELMGKIPEAGKLLDSLAKLDWYFASELRRELSQLTFCFTGPLYRLPTPIPKPGDGPAIPSPIESDYLAYRIDSKVMVDTDMFWDPKLNSRGLTLIHETMHSYLPETTPDRRNKLFGMVWDVWRVDQGLITTRSKLHEQMKGNQIQFPRNVAKLDPYRAQIEFMFGTPKSQRAKLLASAEPEKLVDIDIKKVDPSLSDWDRAALYRLTPRGFLASAVGSALAEEPIETFRTLLDGKTYRTYNPVESALAMYEDLTEEKQGVLLASQRHKAYQDGSFSNLTQAKARVYQGQYRIQASTAFQQSLGVESSNDAPVTELITRPTAQRHGSPIGAIAGEIALLARLGQWDAIERVVTENQAFYDALGCRTQQEAIQKMTPSVPREKAQALEAIRQLKNDRVRRFLLDLERLLGPEQYSLFEARLHLERF